MTIRPEDFIREYARLETSLFLPEIKLYVALAIEPLWHKLQSVTDDPDCPVPFWACPWAGGLGLARFILDNPEYVKGKRVLDFASGSGLVGIAAAMAGAKKVWACDIDELAQTAIGLNAKANGVDLDLMSIVDRKKPPKAVDVILAGDICYEHLMAHRTLAWLRLCAVNGQKAIIGEPGRAYAPKEGGEILATLTVPTNLEVEESETRSVDILEILA